jgi:hypothetical protein
VTRIPDAHLTEPRCIVCGCEMRYHFKGVCGNFYCFERHRRLYAGCDDPLIVHVAEGRPPR